MRVKLLLPAAVAAAAFALPAAAAAAAPVGTVALEECFLPTHRKHLKSKPILDGLDLTRDQKRELQVRLISYPWPNRPVSPAAAGAPTKGFGGIGLTSEQLTVIWSRIRTQEAAMNLDQPPGWPCQPFSNPSRVVESVRDTLVYNGFRANVTFTSLNRRQISFDAIRDGIEYLGAIVKSGPRQIAIQLLELPTIGHSTSPGSPERFTVGFDA